MDTQETKFNLCIGGPLDGERKDWPYEKHGNWVSVPIFPKGTVLGDPVMPSVAHYRRERFRAGIVTVECFVYAAMTLEAAIDRLFCGYAPPINDKARAALQAIADAEPATILAHGYYEAPCDRCKELIAMAREGLEGETGA